LSSKLVRGVRVIDRYLSSYILVVLLFHPHQVDTSTRTNDDDDDEDRRQTGHGRCPIRFEYGAGAAAGRSLSQATNLTCPSHYYYLSHHTLSFWHAGECAILFLYCLNYLPTYILLCLDCGQASKQAPASIYPFFTRLQDDSPAIACAFYRLPTFCMPLRSVCLLPLQSAT